MAYERAHKKMSVWVESMNLVDAVYAKTRSFPKNEVFGLGSQMQRAAVSIPANIAEGASRASRKEYTRFLYIARGSLSEVDTLINICERQNFLSSNDGADLHSLLESVSRLLNAQIKSLNMSQQ